MSYSFLTLLVSYMEFNKNTAITVLRFSDYTALIYCFSYVSKHLTYGPMYVIQGALKWLDRLYVFGFYEQIWRKNSSKSFFDLQFDLQKTTSRRFVFFQNKIMPVLFFKIFSLKLVQWCILQRHRGRKFINVITLFSIWRLCQYFYVELQKTRSPNKVLRKIKYFWNYCPFKQHIFIKIC